MAVGEKSLICQESTLIHSAHIQQFHRCIVNCGFIFLKNIEDGNISIGKNKVLHEVGGWGHYGCP
jgi:hypothetical protein